MGPIATDVACSVVCAHVCVCVCAQVNPAENTASPIVDAVWMSDLGGPREPCIRWQLHQGRGVRRLQESDVAFHQNSLIICCILPHRLHLYCRTVH